MQPADGEEHVQNIGQILYTNPMKCLSVALKQRSNNTAALSYLGFVFLS